MSTQFDRTVFSKRLKKIRLLNGYSTQTDFANAIGISGQAVSYYESGKRLPDAGTLYLLANFFECSIDWLLGISDNLHPDYQYIEHVTGLNDDAIYELSNFGQHFKRIDPKANFIFNKLMAGAYIARIVDAVKASAESIVLDADTYIHSDEGLKFQFDLIEEIKKNIDRDEEAGADKDLIELQRGNLAFSKDLAIERAKHNVIERAELCKFRFLKSMEYLLDDVAAALSKEYGELLIMNKQEEIQDLEFTIEEAARGINKA